MPAILAPVGLGLVVTRLSGAQEAAIPVAILAAAMAAVSLVLIVVTARPLDRAHENVEASRTRTRNLFELAPDGIFVADIDGRYIDVNEAGCRLPYLARRSSDGRSSTSCLPTTSSASGKRGNCCSWACRTLASGGCGGRTAAM